MATCGDFGGVASSTGRPCKRTENWGVEDPLDWPAEVRGRCITHIDDPATEFEGGPLLCGASGGITQAGTSCKRPAGWGTGTTTGRCKTHLIVIPPAEDPGDPPEPPSEWDRVLQNETVISPTVPEGEKWRIGENVVCWGNFLAKDDGVVVSMRPGASLSFRTAAGGVIDPELYVGGGLRFDPALHGNDIGLWIGDHARLDIQGTEKTAWIGPRWDIPLEIPADWDVDDEMWHAAYEAGVETPERWYFGDPFHRLPLPGDARIEAELVTILENDGCPQLVIDDWIANGIPVSIVNVTRDIEIEGPGHIHIHSHLPQLIEYVTIRGMGVSSFSAVDVDEQGSGALRPSGVVLGRYALHMHHGGEGARGTVFRGVALIDSQGRGFVPHLSYGVELLECTAVKSQGEAFWWDTADLADDILVDHMNVMGVFNDYIQPSRFDAISLHRGSDLEMRYSVASGAAGNRLSIGFDWGTGDFPERWAFSHFNLAHNNQGTGIRLWNNKNTPHLMENFVSVQNGGTLENGAYSNGNRWKNVVGWAETGSVGSGILQNTSSTNLAWGAEHGGAPNGQRYTRVCTQVEEGPAVRIDGHNLNHNNYVEYYDCTLIPGAGSPVVQVRKVSGRASAYPKPKQKFIRCYKGGGVPMDADDIEFDADALDAAHMQGCSIYVLDNPLEEGGTGSLVQILAGVRVVTPVS
jgi:hypothetical protein